MPLNKETKPNQTYYGVTIYHVNHCTILAYAIGLQLFAM